jgi:plastocyanin
MKTIYTYCMAALLTCLSGLQLQAASIVVNVEDFEFDPAIFTISTGDTIMWMWDDSGGQHTTTSTVIPQGAAPWDQVMNNNSPMFIYVPTVAGSYDYICSYHSSMGMVGHFTVQSISGITDLPTGPALSLTGTVGNDNSLLIKFNIPQTSVINISLYDALGNLIKVLDNSNKAVGLHEEKYSITGTKSGIYFLTLEAMDSKISKRILVY